MAMCGFEPVDITGVTKDNKLIRTRFTNREMDFMIFVVLKAKHTDNWTSLHRLLMPYFEWAVLKMVLYSIKIQSTEIREKLRVDWEAIDEYMESCTMRPSTKSNIIKCNK